MRSKGMVELELRAMERVWKILLIGVYFTPKATGQDTCTWSPPDLSGRTHAVGSDAEYFINSTTTLRDDIDFTWSYDSAIVVQFTYSSAGDGSFSSPPSANPRVEIRSPTKVTEDLVLLSALVKTVTSSDNGKVLQITRSSCTTGPLGAAVTLTVAECARNPYGAVAVGVNFPSSCGLGCKVNFNCAAPDCGTFEAECLADATWNPAQHKCSSTCESLPSNMRFDDPGTNVECGMTKNVICNGATALACGSTTGRCTTQDNIVTLDDDLATFNCTQVCLAADIGTLATTSDPNPRCGESAAFECTTNCGTFTRLCERNGKWAASAIDPCTQMCLEADIGTAATTTDPNPLCGETATFKCTICETVTFTRLCEGNGIWAAAAIDPCPESCNGDGGLSGGAMAGIVIGVLVASWPSFYL